MASEKAQKKQFLLTNTFLQPYYAVVYARIMWRMQLTTAHVVSCFRNSRNEIDSVKFRQDVDVLLSLEKRLLIKL